MEEKQESPPFCTKSFLENSETALLQALFMLRTNLTPMQLNKNFVCGTPQGAFPTYKNNLLQNLL